MQSFVERGRSGHVDSDCAGQILQGVSQRLASCTRRTETQVVLQDVRFSIHPAALQEPSLMIRFQTTGQHAPVTSCVLSNEFEGCSGSSIPGLNFFLVCVCLLHRPHVRLHAVISVSLVSHFQANSALAPGNDFESVAALEKT